MVGGLIENISVLEDRITLIAVDIYYNKDGDRNAIDIVLTDLPLAVGDSIWWQDRLALWTPKDKSREDVPIVRIGYSRKVDQPCTQESS